MVPFRHRFTSIAATRLLLPIAALLIACSASSGDSTFGASGSGAAPASGGSGPSNVLDPGEGSGDLTEDEACAAEAYSGQTVPLDMQVMLDRSASMQLDNKWTSVVEALKQFVQSPEADGISVGLQYFPNPPSAPVPTACQTDADCGFYGPCATIPFFGASCQGATDDTSCDPVDYTSAEVEIQILPGIAPAIVSSLDAHEPDGNATPTRVALEGAVLHARDRALANPQHLVVVVLATDGEPVGCQFNDVSHVTTTAAWALGENPSLRTFVIGVGAELTALDAIASAGGTDQAYLVDTSQDVTAQFTAALNDIRSAARCEFQIPVPSDGIPNYGLVNVAVSEAGEASNVPGVEGAAMCDLATGGWYYDDPAQPARIILCPTTCERVKESQLDVTVLLGCRTEVN